MNQNQTDNIDHSLDVDATEIDQADNTDVEEVEVLIEEDSTATEIDDLQDRIHDLEIEVKRAKEGQARANADSYNAQKRMEQETEKAKKFALQKFAKELLEVVDNFERAIVNAEQSGADITVIEGLQLTHKSLVSALTKNGVEAVDPLGEKFNPDFHEAVGIYPDAEKDMVGVVLQKGYTLRGRMIRPAMVQVGG